MNDSNEDDLFFTERTKNEENIKKVKEKKQENFPDYAKNKKKIRILIVVILVLVILLIILSIKIRKLVRILYSKRKKVYPDPEVDEQNVRFDRDLLVEQSRELLKEIYDLHRVFDLKDCYDKINKKNRCIVYTSLVGHFDEIRNISVKPLGFDFVAYSEYPLNNTNWEYRKIPDFILNMNISNRKKSRFMKIRPHLFFKDYILSIYLDANYKIIDDISEIFKYYVNSGHVIYIIRNDGRFCIYQEIDIVEAFGLEKHEICENVRERYKKEGFPKEFGLIEGSLIIRRHNEQKCIEFMEHWWEEYMANSQRDQHSFDYVRWKYHYDSKIIYIMPNRAYFEKYLIKKISHNKEN